MTDVIDADDAPLVPCRLAFRLCADVLGGRAADLEHKADPATHGRPGRGWAATGAHAKTPGRLDAARGLRSSAEALRKDSWEKWDCPGVDAACLGYLLAWLADPAHHRDALRGECRAWLGHALPDPEVANRGDLPQAVARGVVLALRPGRRT